MSDHIHSLIVVFDRDLHKDAAERLTAAILMLKNVISVKANVSDFTSCMAEERARRDLGDKLWEVLYPKKSS